MSTLTHTTVFKVETCCRCGLLVAMTEELRTRRLNDHGWFYCPNGHGQHFTGKSKAEKERERAERLERELASADRRIANLDEDVRSARASLRATKGQLTKTKKRAANGVCPCCNRSFANVQRHVKGQHPDFVEATK